MLTVAKVNSAQAAGYADYLEGKSTTSALGDYYLKDGDRVEAPGRWVSGAHHVGAEQLAVVSGHQLRDLMAVRYPGTDRPLRRVGSTGDAVAALDATFSAPKSVSAVWALGDEQLRVAVERAHEMAINEALQYSLGYVAMVRERISGSTVIHTKATDLVATSWRHSTARAVADQLPDPQLHSHVLLHAAVRGDGRVVAIDSRAWLVHRREIAAAYRTQLARGMAELGFEIQRGTGRGSRYFEIAGVPQELLDRWSSRSHQIQEAIDANLQHKRERLQERIDKGGPEAQLAEAQLAKLQHANRLSAAEDRMLRVKTRSAKNPAVTHEDLDRSWTAAAAEVGVAAGQLSAVRSADGRALPALGRQEVLEALTEFDATFMARDARATALEHSAGATIEEVMATLRGLWLDGQVVMLADGSQTTSPHRNIEHDVVSAVERLVENDMNQLPAALIKHSADQINERLESVGGKLSDEQEAAFRLATSDRQLVVIEGQAGTGKSTVLQAVALAHQAAGRQVIVTSTAGLAAQRLGDDLAQVGVTATPYSTAALIHAIDTGRVELGPDTTVIHDEAALASTREQDQLLGAVERSGSRLILVGDPQQSKPVGAGGMWRHIEHIARDGEARIELTQNLRARDPADQRDQQYFRNGQHLAAITGYDQRGRVHFSADLADAEDAALEAAQQDRRSGKSTIVIAQTSNDHLDELNARAQALRNQEGELGQDGVPVPGRPYQLHAGDQVQVRRNAAHAEHGRLGNGTRATVTSVNPETDIVRLAMGDGAEVELDRSHIQAADLRLAYVQHPFPAQGTTTDTAHLIVAEHVSREGAYVAITRAREEAHIYGGTDTFTGEVDQPAIAQLAEVLGREEPDLPSIARPLAREIATRPTAPADRPVWREALGDPPTDQTERARWDEALARVAAYRQTYGIPDSDPEPLGPEPSAGAFGQRLERERVDKDAKAVLQPGRGREADSTRSALEPTPGWEP